MKENKRRPYRNWKKNGRKGHFVRARADSAEPTRKMRVEAPEVPWDNKYLDDPVTDERGVVKGCDTPLSFGIASAIALACFIAAAIYAAAC